MNIYNLLSTPQRIKILKKIIYSDYSITVNKAGRELKLSKGLVSKFFKFNNGSSWYKTYQYRRKSHLYITFS